MQLPNPDDLDRVLAVLRSHGVAAAKIGEVEITFGFPPVSGNTEALEAAPEDEGTPADALAAYDRAMGIV